jgi:hypothetical protein
MTAAAIPIGMMVAGSVLSAGGQIQAGNAAAAEGIAGQQAMDYRAAEERSQAQTARGVASVEASNTARDTGLVLSSARARAAASGAGATDPTVVSLESGIAGRGEINLLTQLASGEERAKGLENQANLDIYQGQQLAEAGRVQQRSSRTRALASLLSGAGGLFARYGGSPPSAAPLGPLPADPGGLSFDPFRLG